MIRRSYSAAFPLLAALVCILEACSLLGAPQEERSRFFMLTPIADASAPLSTTVAPGREFAVGVGPINFPDYLKRPEIVTRVSSDRVELSEDNRWAEPLDSSFQRVLGQDLSQMLGTQRIVLFPWYGRPRLDYQVVVRVHRFDTGSDGQSQLRATWIIEDGRSGSELFATESTASDTVAAGDASGSAALSRLVGTLGRQIAERIVALNRSRSHSPDAR